MVMFRQNPQLNAGKFLGADHNILIVLKVYDDIMPISFLILIKALFTIYLARWLSWLCDGNAQAIQENRQNIIILIKHW